MHNRIDRENLEKEALASYAMLSCNTRGRKLKEKENVYRSVYQRDRDRIIHATAFRRLEYKTQVFVNHEADYYRTRLTHSIEVAQIARTIARALRLNEDLAEAISLAHDIGHTPFGHSGEEALHQIMKDKGGFEHNKQGLRVVDQLEYKYFDFPGLNLTYEVREGIIKHKTSYDNPVADTKGFVKDEYPTLEARIVNYADEIAYNNHDLDDGLKGNFISIEDLYNNVYMIKEYWDYLKEKYENKDNELILKKLIRNLIGKQITDVIEETERNIKVLNIKTIKDVRKTDGIVSFSNKMVEKQKELKKYLYENLYKHYKVVKMSNRAKRIIRGLFEAYMEDINQLPPQFKRRIDKDNVERIVCDYIAGMTDRYSQDEYTRLYLPYAKI
ncbi:deoxyguanosinetriphosphate triphosphohydrolase [candidate division TA06 bacterium]|uniref:Deoxyguanosinetriphosphate triphosphohydrolase-like protein n=1 Tax=candidate division TA06 bacterium TaxID=2250710 RepID=A0A660SN27_UNCT6|nr:MAG: deoxyguanosinetriphosphate triphosphohydrolase [candidate division TA06 bacterium]